MIIKKEMYIVPCPYNKMEWEQAEELLSWTKGDLLVGNYETGKIRPMVDWNGVGLIRTGLTREGHKEALGEGGNSLCFD